MKPFKFCFDEFAEIKYNKIKDIEITSKDNQLKIVLYHAKDDKTYIPILLISIFENNNIVETTVKPYKIFMNENDYEITFHNTMTEKFIRIWNKFTKSI